MTNELEEREKTAIGFTRRDFMKQSGAAALVLSLGQLRFAASSALAAEDVASQEYPYRNWEDVYRHKWVWDKVVRSTHCVNCWYQAHCAWNVYVKDGMVWREEQAADYPQIRPDVSDFNPRGCQKGACFSERMYDPTRRQVPAQARRRARLGEVGADLLGAGARRDRRLDDRHDRQGRHRPGDLGPRAGHFARHADGGAGPPRASCSTPRPST